MIKNRERKVRLVHQIYCGLSSLLLAASVQSLALAAGTTGGQTRSVSESTSKVQDAERAVQKKPSDRAARLKAAETQLAASDGKRSRRAAAQRHLEALLATKPDDVNALKLMAQIELDKGNAAASALYYQSAIRFAPDDATAHLGLGQALTLAGDEVGANAAFAEYRRAAGLPPVVDESATPPTR